MTTEESNPRITLNLTEGGLLELWLNETGRALLIKELQNLSEKWDHLHFDPEGRGDLRVSKIPYRETDRILDWGKIYLRPDEWDARYFPHS